MSRRRVFGAPWVFCLLAIAPFGMATAETIYDSIPSPYPGSFVSWGFQATSTDEFGNHIAFAGVDRNLGKVVVSLTNWACENDFDLVGGVWVPNRGATDACVTTPGSGYNHPITLNIYGVDNTGPDPAVGPLIASKTINPLIPFRPSWDSTNCTAAGGTPATDVPFGGRWYDPVLGFCVHGYAFNITFDFSSDGVVLPDEVIYGVAYNTHTHGANPIGAPGPYSSLNVSLTEIPGGTGADVEPGTLYMDSSFGGFYCDGGAGGTDTFRRDADPGMGLCWWYPTASDPLDLVVRFNAADGACCTDGPGTMSDCVELSETDCNAGGGLYLGAGTQCANVLDCVPLSVELGSLAARRGPEGVRIEWTTIREVDTMGFRILREDGRDKAATLISGTIPAAGSGLAGASYEFLDNARQDTAGVRYWLEDIDIYGRVTRHGPIEIDAATRSAAPLRSAARAN